MEVEKNPPANIANNVRLVNNKGAPRMESCLFHSLFIITVQDNPSLIRFVFSSFLFPDAQAFEY